MPIPIPIPIPIIIPIIIPNDLIQRAGHHTADSAQRLEVKECLEALEARVQSLLRLGRRRLHTCTCTRPRLRPRARPRPRPRPRPRLLMVMVLMMLMVLMLLVVLVVTSYLQASLDDGDVLALLPRRQGLWRHRAYEAR